MFRKINLISAVLVCFLSLLIQDGWASDEAESNGCHFLSSQFSQIEFAKGDERITYKLTSRNKKWTNVPFGWHSTGILKCEDCLERGTAVGMYHFQGDYASFKHGDLLPKRPTNSTERIERAHETFGYPFHAVTGNDLIPLSHRDGIKKSNLAGYAVLFRVELDENRRLLNTNPAFRDLHLLVLSLTDDCLRFDTTIQMQGAPPAGIGFVDTILDDISISYESDPLDQKTKEQVAKRLHDKAQRRQDEDELIKLMPKRN